MLAAGLVALAAVVIVTAIALPHLTSPASTRSGPQPPALAASQVLHLAINTGGGTNDIPTYDAGQASDAASIPIVNLLYDGLVTLEQNLKIEKWGADNITISPDGLTYTFHLRPNQKFTDGTPVKASDYAFSLNRTINPCLASPVGYYLPQANLKDANAFNSETCKPDGKTIVGAIQTLIGDSIVADDSAATVTMTLAQPAGFFLDALSYTSNDVVEQRVLGDGLGATGAWTANLAKPEGNSGMFEVKSNDKAGHLVLVPNPHWWGVALGKRPHFAELDIHLFENTDQEYAAYDAPNAAFDYLDNIPIADLASASRLPDFHAVPKLLVQTIALNWQVPPFDNRDARQAFCLAINRDALAAAVVSPGVPVNVSPLIPSWHLVPRGMPGYYPQLLGIDGVTATTGDLAMAQAHWATYLATLHGKPVPAVKLSINTGFPTQQRLANALVEQWSAAFPGVQISSGPFYIGGILILHEEDTRHFQAFRFAWQADYPDPQDFLSLLYSSTSPYNNMNASVPDADTLLAAADTLSSPDLQAARLALYNQAEQELMQQVAACPLFQGQSAYRLRSYVVGMQQSSLGLFPNDDWLAGYIARH
jgi:peptide/nickel transport system substrate-binding protein/oligopeptide transport system substrate-binding protein